jgi:hypothetical protein
LRERLGALGEREWAIMQRVFVRAWCAVLLPALALSFPGCGGDDALNSRTATRMKGLSRVYLDYAVAKSGAGPANEQTLKKHIRSMPGVQLASNGVDPKEIDLLFTSERDQEPLVVLYGTGVTQISATSAPLVAHEKTGKNGKRLVAFANGNVEVVDDSQFQELLSKKQ